MKYFLPIGLCLLAANAAWTQTKLKPKPAAASAAQVKTVRGVLVRGLDDYRPQVSPDGAVVALKSVYSSPFFSAPFVVAIDVEKGTVREISHLGEISVDGRYAYGLHTSHPDTRPGKSGTAQGFKLAGIFSDTAERIVFFSPVIQMLDAQTNRVVGPGSIGAEMDLSLYDLNSSKAIRVIATGKQNDLGSTPQIRQPNYVVYQNDGRCIAVGLAEGDAAVQFDCRGAMRPYLADDKCIYLHPLGADGQPKLSDITAYDRRTGRQLATQSFSDATEGQMMYAAFNGRLYRYDRATATVFEEEPRDGSFAVTAQAKTPSLTLPANQKWTMVACKGPSVLFVPLNIEAAEAGGVAANTATLISMTDGKPLLRISPFFNRSAAVLAQQTAERKAADEDMARRNEQWAKEVAAKKAAEPALKAARCKEAWGNAQFNRGVTRMWGLFEKYPVILDSYDCDKDRYKIWDPRHDGVISASRGKYVEVSGEEFRRKSEQSDKQWHTCERCGGHGNYEVTESKTRVKELPWGYFSHIETRSIRTTTTTRNQYCNVCDGRGVVLK